MQNRIVHPSDIFGGELCVPGDKSISHRLAMLTALAKETSRIEGFLCSEDCLHTLAAMEALGAVVEREGTCIRVTGTGGCLRSPDNVLDMGNSGTGIRLLAGLLAGQPVVAEMTGDASLRSRPMTRIQSPLVSMGAKVELLGEGGCAPVRITGGSLQAIRYALPMASAQVKSAVLLAGLSAAGTTVVVEPKATRDHTERLLKAMGIGVEVDNLTITLRPSSETGLSLRGGDWIVPGDFSSAAFWITAAAMREGSDLTVHGVGLNPRRTALLDVLERMGAEIHVQMEPGSISWEPCGNVRVRGHRLRGTDVGGDEIPNLIDELPLIAVVGAVAEGTTCVRDAAELRVKESDRISAIGKNLLRAGVNVEETADGFHVKGGVVSGGSFAESFGDHRIVMAMAVLALQAQGPIELRNVDCVATSYPEFWRDLEHLTQNI